jgi:predicted DNA-binding transcriptional regulator AlpA
LLRQPQVLSLVPFSRATLFRSIKADKFPRPVKLSERVSAWRSEDIQAWMDRQSDRR